MNRKLSRQDVQIRQRIAQEAARYMVEHGIKDFLMAKQKAADGFGITDRHVMPRNIEIEQAMVEYQRIFHADKQPQRLRHLRETAVNAMQLLAEYRPRLVGSVQRGTTNEHSDVNLHAFTDTPELLGHFLDAHKIPYQQHEKRLRISKDKYEIYPALGFIAGDVSIDIVIMPGSAERQAPLSPVNGKPMQRYNLEKVKALLVEQQHVEVHY